jgi:antitoxin HicB
MSAQQECSTMLVNEDSKNNLGSNRIRQRVRPAELARRMQTTPQEVNRLTNIHHTSRIDGIAGAMKALGKTLEIRAV